MNFGGTQTFRSEHLNLYPGQVFILFVRTVFMPEDVQGAFLGDFLFTLHFVFSELVIFFSQISPQSDYL
jgi:hypothetical protein